MSSPPEYDFHAIGATENEEHETRMESIEEIRAAIQARRKATEKEAVEEDTDTTDFRPVRRPFMAMLCLLDDGKQDGEWFRLRRDVTIIGRSEGEIIVPHETEMSGRHLAISRQVVKDRYRWYLTDLDSTNGSFVRVSKAVLRQGQEILLGGRRYRFNAAGPAVAKGADPAGGSTRAFTGVQASDLIPSLVEVTTRGEGQRLYLKQQENWIGRDASLCSVVLANDTLVSPRHAKISRDARGEWQFENAGSRNGSWMRFKKVPVDTSSQFQIGEQRCILKILV